MGCRKIRLFKITNDHTTMSVFNNSASQKKYNKITSALIGVSGLPLGYYNMPKAGCTTIKNILYYIEKGEWLNTPLEIHRVISRGEALLSDESFQRQRMELESSSPYFTFSFVRHPGRRVYSAFIEKILTRHEYAIGSIQNHLIKEMNFTHRGKKIESLDAMPPLEEMEIENLRSNFKKFLKFVQLNITNQSRFYPNQHWVVQSERIDKLKDQDRLDFVGRIEDFKDEFSMILKRVGIDRPDLTESRFNEGPKPPISYEDLAGSVLRNSIRSIYAKDFDRYGYNDF
jgi:hypothetical protein